MSEHLIPVSFALTPRMQSFLELRDALRCLTQATEQHAPLTWLAAAKDLHDLFIGDGNKKPAIPNVMSLFGSLRKHYMELAKKYPDYQERLQQACSDIDMQADIIREHVPAALELLEADAWINAYSENVRTLDLLGHKLALPQVMETLWFGHDTEYAGRLHHMLKPILPAIEKVNTMLHTHTPWQKRVAKNGCDQITLHAQDEIGLIILGLTEESLGRGIVPECSGFRSTVRVRFSRWQPGRNAEDLTSDYEYSIMMVPLL